MLRIALTFFFSSTKLQLKKGQITKQEDTVSTFVCSPDIVLGKAELQKLPTGPEMFSEVRGGYPVIKGEKNVNERIQLASKNMLWDSQIPHTHNIATGKLNPLLFKIRHGKIKFQRLEFPLGFIPTHQLERAHCHLPNSL